MRKRKVKLRLLPIALAGGILAGCATVGKPVPSQAVQKIKIGQTTRQEIQAAFGNPWRTGIEDGETSWTFGYYHISLFGQAEADDLKIVFNDKGTVASYSFNTTRPAGSE